MFKLVQKQLVRYSKRFHSAMVNITPPMLDLEVNRIVWVDMEMTGLNVDQDKIMEIACLVTDADLNIIAEGPDIIIHQPDSVLKKMNAWCKKQHKKTGLTAACLNSMIHLEQAENEILDFVKQHVTEKMSPLAGNSVYMDRMFLIKNMPSLHNYLHYRLIDVSTVKELCRRWNLEVYKKDPSKQFTHRALSDIKESIEELKFYKENFFKQK
ncbi:oligoribonuclease, mitochondrial isoform X2 [Diabrotica virgifera virgifera]|uniref:Exonuclease domain-containing protein n=1 Tax=Diabrotica virgifera virgifera TaxID=50390 RepID=A0ABM5IHU0_DIAVI|nr:oligoribonuclease, mitochondrial isoform X2 [Diabrotica virgifera virgifera]